MGTNIYLKQFYNKIHYIITKLMLVTRIEMGAEVRLFFFTCVAWVYSASFALYLEHGNRQCHEQIVIIVMYPTVLGIKRSLPLVLTILVFLGWVIYLHSPSDHTKPVLSQTPLNYLAQSWKAIQMGEQNNGSVLQYGQSKEDFSILKDIFKTYYSVQNGIETTTLLDIYKENISSNLITMSTSKSVTLPNSLQDENDTSFRNTYSVNIDEFNKLNFASAWTQVLERRQQRVVEVCRQHSKQLKRIWGYGNLLYDTKHHLAYCRTAKAGTTWWLRSLLQWSGVSTDGLTPDTIHQVANQVFPPLDAQNTQVQLDANPFIFMAVRHPFTRLVSAYHDKIASGYRKDLYSQMINNYRKLDSEKQDFKSKVLESSDSRSDVPTFREFVLFAAQQVNHCALVPNSACMLEVDVHWRPAHDRCAPCDVHYDAILKLETFDSDERYIKLITGMPPNKKNGNSYVQNSQSVKTGQTTEDLTAEYFSNLTPDDVNKVTQAYYYDFFLFGYDPHKYY